MRTQTHADAALAKKSKAFSDHLHAEQAFAALEGTPNFERFDRKTHFITSECEDASENGLHGFCSSDGRVRVLQSDGRHYRDYEVLGDGPGPIKPIRRPYQPGDLSQEDADRLFRNSEHFDQLDEDYGRTEEGYLYGLADGSMVLVDWDGKLTHSPD